METKIDIDNKKIRFMYKAQEYDGKWSKFSNPFNTLKKAEDWFNNPEKGQFFIEKGLTLKLFITGENKKV